MNDEFLAGVYAERCGQILEETAYVTKGKHRMTFIVIMITCFSEHIVDIGTDPLKMHYIVSIFTPG